MNSTWLRVSSLWIGTGLLLLACESETVKGPATGGIPNDTGGADVTDTSELDSENSTTGDTASDPDAPVDTDSASSTDSGVDTSGDTATSGSGDAPLPAFCIDADSDGWCVPFDCNDNDPTIHPGAYDIPGDGIDQNCDGQDAPFSDTDTESGGDPTTCAQAEAERTYMGCEFYPTVTYNMVWYNFAAQTGFEFAVVVANDQSVAATIQITGGALSAPLSVTVPAGELRAIPLPWVVDLKGTTFNTANTSGNRVSSSVRVNGGAYRMTSSVPVTAWQFSPLEYEITPVPAGCIDNLTNPSRCYSVTNDASLLLPKAAMTGTYRVFSYGGYNTGDWGDAPGGIAITATENNTLVRVQLTANIAAGTDVTAANAGTTVEYTMNAGDVVQLLGRTGQWWGDAHGDLTGSVVVGLDAANPGSGADQNYQPVQVIGLSPIVDLTPSSQISYADHVEATILPAEVLGNEYIVVAPTGSGGSPVQHIVRFVGNVNGTTLTYQGSTPPGAPTVLNAGQYVDLQTTAGFIVSSQDKDHPFMVVSFIQNDEPAVTPMVTPEQFRRTYSFLAPVSYAVNYADVLIPDGATVTLNGALIGGFSTAIGTTGWSVRRVALNAGPGGDGKHKLVSDMPVGLQVMGYGHATSYYYPGGLNLDIISQPPIIIIE